MRTLLAVLILLTGFKTADPLLNSLFITWNVGQGQWSSLITEDTCHHFDMGGEYYPLAVDPLCLKRKNILFLSHSDWDHISFIFKFSQRAKSFCLHKKVREKINSRKVKLLSRLQICSHTSPSVQEINFVTSKFKRNNDLSRVYVQAPILFPGDSTKTAEKLWSSRISSKLTILMVGHHGSKTSTSQVLLSQLPNLNLAIVSARKRKYGHPHYSIQYQLLKNKIPMITTEHWGHIAVKLNLN